MLCHAAIIGGLLKLPLFLHVIVPGMVGGSSQPTCDFTWAIETLSACGSVLPTQSARKNCTTFNPMCRFAEKRLLW